MLSVLRRAFDDLATVGDAPHRTAAALALGVGLSFSPLLGLQILLGIGAAIALRLSRVAVIIGLCANLPWIMVPWYALTTAAAAAVLGTATTGDIGDRVAHLLSVPFYEAAFWRHARGLLDVFFWPFLLGPTVGAAALAAITYNVSLRFLTRRAHERAAALERALLLDAEASRAGDLSRDAEQGTADRHVDQPQRTSLGEQ
jgi:uncharacterized protein (DUF2062 family)